MKFSIVCLLAISLPLCSIACGGDNDSQLTTPTDEADAAPAEDPPLDKPPKGTPNGVFNRDRCIAAMCNDPTYRDEGRPPDYYKGNPGNIYGNPNVPSKNAAPSHK